MAVLEGAWDCAQCKEAGIPGSLLNCPSCGDPHNARLDVTEAYYLPHGARSVPAGERTDAGPNWNCKCGEANRATETVCRSCGEPRSGNDTVNPVRTYVDGVDAEGVTLTDPAQLEADWVDAVLTEADNLQQLEDDPVGMPARTLSAAHLPRQAPVPDYASGRGSTGRTTGIFAGLLAARGKLKTLAIAVILAVAAIGGLAALYANFIATESVTLTVQSTSWERQIEVESFQTLTLEDWDVPFDGRVISSSSEIRSYDRVIDHYETKYRTVTEQVYVGSHEEEYACGSTTTDMGNGYFESETTYCSQTVADYETVSTDVEYEEPVYRNDPVYDTMYTYEVDRWVTDHFERASGRTGPYWPYPEITGANERIGDERRESYIVVLVDEENRSFDREVSLATWESVREGLVLEGEQTKRGALREVDWPVG